MKDWEWTERYPGQPEILRYLNFVADRYDLKRDISFNTRVTEAHYDEAANRWHVRTEAGASFSAKFLDHRRRLPVHRKRAEHPGPRNL